MPLSEFTKNALIIIPSIGVMITILITARKAIKTSWREQALTIIPEDSTVKKVIASAIDSVNRTDCIICAGKTHDRLDLISEQLATTIGRVNVIEGTIKAGFDEIKTLLTDIKRNQK